MFFDSLGAVSMTNGVIRIETVTRNAKGQDEVSGEMMIPANRIGNVAAGFQKLIEELQEKIKEAQAQAENAAESENA